VRSGPAFAGRIDDVEHRVTLELESLDLSLKGGR
jgi:hypothetical protein